MKTLQRTGVVASKRMGRTGRSRGGGLVVFVFFLYKIYIFSKASCMTAGDLRMREQHTIVNNFLVE